MDEIDYYLAFSHCKGIGPLRFKKLIEMYKSVQKAYEGDIKDLQELLGVVLADKFNKFRNTFDPVIKQNELKSKHISVIPLSSDKYPILLKEITDPPICLYAKGNINKYEWTRTLCIGIVGTRRPSSYGVQTTTRFARELIQAGCVIVSGMALGIDAVAHTVSLQNNGETIAVLGCGVDLPYPPSNTVLYHKISQHGLVISEFPPGHFVQKGLFIARNRIISGIAKGILVTEGAKDSGALITARYAAEQGREVFAVPSPITSELSEAPNKLLKQGAKLVSQTEDILEEFGINQSVLKNEQKYKALKGFENEIFLQIRHEPMLIDDISKQLDTPVSEIMQTISILELKRIIKKNEQGKYELII